MKFVYFDASAGLSGDMILGALLDLGVGADLFRKAMSRLKLPVRIEIGETRRSGLRGLRVDVVVERKKTVTRTWADVRAAIDGSPFSETVKENSRQIFRRLFKAEAAVHGSALRQTHLHEAGADDALVDVVGCCWLAETLDIGSFFCSPLNVGQGFVETAHGVLPVPPPAVAELLKNVPVYSAWAKEELVTPTGAAVVSTLARGFVPFPEISYQRVGQGAGGRDTRGFPNILRAFYGDVSDFKSGKKVFVVEATVDDASPPAMGALDAFLTPVVMKKNRLASKLTLLAETDKMEALIEAAFRETTTIGIRFFPVERRVLDREYRRVKVRGQEIRIKISRLNGEIVNIQPEFADCRNAADRASISLKEVTRLAMREYDKKR